MRFIHTMLVVLAFTGLALAQSETELDASHPILLNIITSDVDGVVVDCPWSTDDVAHPERVSCFETFGDEELVRMKLNRVITSYADLEPLTAWSRNGEVTSRIVHFILDDWPNHDVSLFFYFVHLDDPYTGLVMFEGPIAFER